MSIRQGNKVIAGHINYHPDLFDHKWADHILNDASWLRADTFSWQSGAVYQAAYNHLADDITGKSLSSETISGVTVQFYLADDGHKICPATEESNVVAIYAATGVAWYYILDTVNERFKLPRTKYGFNGLRDTVGDYVAPELANIIGTFSTRDSGGTYNDGETWNTKTGAFSGNTGTYNHVQASAGGGWGPHNGILTFDASKANSVYKDGASVQQPATQMYLYFYVGNFTQTALENTAGLNAELFNDKLDLDLGNATSVTKETIVGWGVPDYTAGVALSNNTTYTADKNYFIVQKASGSIGTSLTINNVEFSNNVANATTTLGWYVSVGDIYKTSSSGNFTKYPLKGVNNA